MTRLSFTEQLTSIRVKEPEIMCQIKDGSIRAEWQVENDGDRDWPTDLEFVPIATYPTVRIYFQSKIHGLQTKTAGKLCLNVELNEGYQHKCLAAVLRLKEGKKWLGPTFVLFASVNSKVEDQLTD